MIPTLFPIAYPDEMEIATTTWEPCIRSACGPSEFGLSLGQVACAEMSNETTAIPELFRLVDIKGMAAK